MPLGAMLMALMIGWEIKPKVVLDEIGHGNHSPGFAKFFTICVKFVVPIVMAFVLAGQMISYFGGNSIVWYAISGVLLVGFWIYAAVGNKKEAEE